jgi:hypothetical protein
MNYQTLILEKALLTNLTAEWILSSMTLDMIMHGILILLYCIADTADELSGGILLVFKRHLGTRVPGGRAVQFFGRAPSA